MKSLVAVVAFGLLVWVGAASSASGSGLRGRVLVRSSPICRVGTPCTKPAKRVRLVFSRRGRVVGQARTNDRGKYRIRLRPHTYRVSCRTRSGGRAKLEPQRITVRRGRYRKVVFTLDVGIR
jgi:hypothetical protein